MEGRGSVQCDTVTGRGRGLVDAYIRMGKNYKHSFISLSHILLGLVVWFWFFLSVD